jgi:hypothetical protein
MDDGTGMCIYSRNRLIFNQTSFSDIELKLIEKFNLKQYNLKKLIQIRNFKRF